MPSGIETWSGLTGAKTLSITDRLTRVIELVYFPLTTATYNEVPAGFNGSRVNNILNNGTPFFFFLPGSSPQGFYDAYPSPVPVVNFSGNTVSWTWSVQNINAWKSSSISFGEGDTLGDIYLAYGAY